jgi:hypothetical protein
MRETHRKHREFIIAAYGGECRCCTEDKIEFLEFDHINDDGSIQRKITGYNTTNWLYQDYRRTGRIREDIRIYCSNCHRAYTHWGYCPHVSN